MFSKSDKRSSWISLICTDLNECQAGSFRCHARAVCVNVSGSYSCRCRPGYVGNGKTVCEGKVCSAFPCWNPVVRGEGIRLEVRKKKYTAITFTTTLKNFAVEMKNKLNWALDRLGVASVLEPVSRESRKLFGLWKPVAKMESTCFVKLIFWHVFNVREAKRIAKFDGLERRRCEDGKGIAAPRNKPEKPGPRP